MTVKKICIWLFIGQLWLLHSVAAQFNSPGVKLMDLYQRTKLLVVLDTQSDTAVNAALKDALGRYWTFQSVEFIDEKEYEDKRFSNRHSFFQIKCEAMPYKGKNYPIDYLHISMGAKSRKDTLMELIFSFPLAYRNAPPASYIYKIPMLVQFMQAHIYQLRERPNVKAADWFAYYNSHSSEIKTSELYFLQEDMSDEINSIVAIKLIYPFDVKFVLVKDLADVIHKQHLGIAMLHKVAPEKLGVAGPCLKYIMSADGLLFFINRHFADDVLPNTLLREDLEDISKR